MLREFAGCVVLAAAAVVAAGCGPSPGSGAPASGPAPRAIVQNYEILIRNNCIHPVRLEVAKQRPAPASAGFEVGSGVVAERTMPSDQRLWLWDDGGWSSKRAAVAKHDPYVFDIYCHAIEGRRGPL